MVASKQPQVWQELVQGLSSEQVTHRLKTEGYNELPSRQERHLGQLIWEIFSEPIFLLLAGCGGIYFFLGDAQEAIILLGFILLIVGINLYQEQKTEQSLKALRDMASPRALVIRNGQRDRIPGREVVRGDVIILAEGDRVPADAVLRWSTHLSIDESLLTGESIPIQKRISTRNGTDSAELSQVYAGTLVVQGQGIAEVTAIGSQTHMGQIGKALQVIKTEDTILQKETRRMVSKLMTIAIAICVAVVIIYGSSRGDWLQGVLSGLALAMAILPNEIPVVLTIFLALGAWRFSRQRVLTRHTPVVETLGAVTVLCVDKTGTLTFNRMDVAQLFVYDLEPGTPQPRFWHINQDVEHHLPEAFHLLIEFGILASHKDPFDPMEKALQQIGQDYLARTEHLHMDWQLLHEYPLSAELLAMSCVWESPRGDLTVAAKGAPEAIAELCHLHPQAIEDLNQHIQVLATAGLRVLGVARGRQTGGLPQIHHPLAADGVLPEDGRLPLQQHEFEFQFVGLVGLADPVRPSVAPAIAECHAAGIRVVMITGDYPTTARQIADQIGLDSREVITGAELAHWSPDQLEQGLQTAQVFARVTPSQKLQIVQALQQRGEIVAMTGDGINDAPALKAAHVGIAMGERGTDVAREAADLVLLQDDFADIVAAVKLGRRIFANLKKGIVYTLAVHIPIAGISFFPVLLGWPLVLMPIHIAFLHLIIDPACTIVFEAEPAEANSMRTPPRNPKLPLFDRQTLQLAVLQGVAVLIALLLVFIAAYYGGNGEFDARTLAFTTLIMANLSLILVNRSWSMPLLETLRVPNRALWWVLAGTILGLGLILASPPLRSLFRFSSLHGNDILFSVTAGLLSVFWFEGWKWWQRRRCRFNY
jgi:P-type Ca2+ transporter type 2C